MSVEEQLQELSEKASAERRCGHAFLLESCLQCKAKIDANTAIRYESRNLIEPLAAVVAAARAVAETRNPANVINLSPLRDALADLDGAANGRSRYDPDRLETTTEEYAAGYGVTTITAKRAGSKE